MTRHRFLPLTLILTLVTAGLGAGHAASAASGYGDRLGTVELPAACAAAATAALERGLALLHHMTYEGARDAFVEAAAADPECAVAYWGQAMTFIHPLWSDPPAEADFERGRALLERARSLEPESARLSAYVAAAEAYYEAGWSRVEKANLTAFERGWEAVHRQFPEDPEAACFYALAQLGTADPGDKSYAKQRRAGQLADSVRARIPDHPGAHHYAIHAYDYPTLAAEALEVARSYGRIAPAVPHALHMPTHIFTRLGLWAEAIEFNARSADAALHHPVNGAVSMHHLHALDYLAYAHLQRADDAAARQVAEQLGELRGPFQHEMATPYTFAAVPARLALERQNWAAAAALEPRQPVDFPWDNFPAVEAITHFARALGGARSGQPELAREALDRLAELGEAAAKLSSYWAQQVEIQRLAALAWLSWEEGRKEEALATMRQAAELEASTEKHPVTPGEVLPARELLADMLLESGRAAEAEAAYEVVLAHRPGRLNSLWGAGRAAELMNDTDGAQRRFKALVDACADPDADTAWGRLVHARGVANTLRIGG